MEFKKGDVCSLEVTVLAETEASRKDGHVYVNAGWGEYRWVDTNCLTLLRRAPVDLATCELPEGGLQVLDEHGRDWLMLARREGWAAVFGPVGGQTWMRVSDLRPLGAPAPDKSEVERLRARVAQLEQGYSQCLDELKSWVHDSRDGVWNDDDFAGMFNTHEETLASTAPTCPPGHIMIGDRAVSVPMRRALILGAKYWVPNLGNPDLVLRWEWTNHRWDDHRLKSGLIHSTEAAARAHAEALIALSDGEGV